MFDIKNNRNEGKHFENVVILLTILTSLKGFIYISKFIRIIDKNMSTFPKIRASIHFALFLD